MRRGGTGLALLALACSGAPEDDAYSGPPIPWEHRPFPALSEPAANRSTPDEVELGRLLFFDPILSADGAVACATCHSEVWGMSDGLALSVGVGGEGPTGPGRTGPNVTRRNAQTLWNVAWRAPLFWDGRSASLEQQVLAPLAEPVELGKDAEAVAAELRDIVGYVQLFERAFPDQPEPVTVQNLTFAIAAFERTIVSRRAPYDRYVEGDAGALSERAVRGMFLFGEAGCAGCHVPPLFEAPRYAARGIGGDADAGRFEVTGAAQDRGAFRVPTLRNVRDSGPYFHDGSVVELRDAVAHEASLAPRPLTADEIDAVTTFLDKALTDLFGEPERPKSVPSGLPVPVDGFRVPR